MIQKLHIGTTLAALILFFLPWIDLQCSHQSVATQTGVQTIYGSHTPVEQSAIKLEVDDERYGSKADGGNMGYAPLVALAMLAVAAAVVTAFRALRSAAVRRGRMVGLLCALALTLLAVQMMIGFPVRKSVAESMTKDRTMPLEEVEAAMAGAMMANFEIRYLPALYVELVLLGISTLILANDWLDRVRRRGAEGSNVDR